METETNAQPLRLAIDTIEYSNMGDHAERVRRSHVQLEGETVDGLVRRVFPYLSSPYIRHDASNEVVLRVMVAQDGKTVTGQTPYSNEAPF